VKPREWQEEAQKRQRNIAPEDTIRNDAIAEGLLIRGDRRLTGVQRVTAVVLGLIPASVAILSLWAASDIATTGGFHPVYALIVLPIILFGVAFGYVAFRMIRTGITGGRRDGRNL
jgi:hypothetical protein